ncbi:MAG: hypothetical protein M3O06_04250, partial [Pseudomonadota bacterium]|nr:hypothetical protein [Pseudomonadota bacterium]
MASLDATAQAMTRLAPNFRRYELPWAPTADMERRYRTILRYSVLVFLLLAALLAFLPRREHVVNTESLPERVVQLAIEPPPPPPPPPPPKPEKPLVKAPVSAKPSPTVPVDPRVKASKSGLLANLDDLAALRDRPDL